MEIRTGEARDLDQIEAIQAASPEAASWPAAGYLAYDLLVACDGPCVIGFLASRRVAGDESELLNIAVAPGHRRRGVGRALLRSFFREAGVVYLEVRASNQAAREFYKSFGFQELTVRKEYYSAPEEGVLLS